MPDFYIDETGDIVIQGNDIRIATPRESDRNLVISRLTTALGGNLSDPAVGVNRIYKGEANSPILLTRLKNEVLSSLTRDGAFSRSQVDAEVVALNEKDMAIMVDINKPYRDSVAAPLQLVFSYNPNYGEINFVTGDK